jgi:serine protease
MRRRTAFALLLTAATLAPAAGARAAQHVAHEVVVGLKAPAGEATAARAAAPRFEVLHVRDVGAAIRRLRRRADVDYAVPNVIAHASDFRLPNDPGRSGKPGGWEALQWNFVGPFGINAPAAWAHAFGAGHPGADDVTIAVLDTGVAYANRGRFRRSPDLGGTRFVRGYDFVDHDPFANDLNGHGTHVASTLAETTDNGIALAGLAYRARIMPVRVLDAFGEGNATTIARGIRFAVVHGAKIINLSLEFSADVTARDIPQLLSAVAYAHRRGVLLVGASGNEAHSAVAYPARARDVVSVGATTEHGCLSDFSNDGQGLDFVAPGGGADAQLAGDANCHPLDKPGLDIYQMTFTGASLSRFGLPSGYEGTSMAAPHVSGTAALVIASGVLGPNPSPADITARLAQTVRDLGPPGYDTRYGAGLIDAGRATDPAIPFQRAG